MTIPEPVVLTGCTPTPLASYLKALGILRLLSSPINNITDSAADPGARGWWENESFYLRTMLTCDDVCRFFLEDYAPSPIIAPWNGRAGFLEGENQGASTRNGAVLVDKLQRSQVPRYKNMRRTIKYLRANSELSLLNEIRARQKKLDRELKTLRGEEKESKKKEQKDAKKQENQLKQTLLPALRSTTEPDHISYIDACYVLSTNKDKDSTPMYLFGTGGNDGSRDFGVNFADKLEQLFGFCNVSAMDSAMPLLEGALFGGGCLGSGNCGTMGQFSPGQGGCNSTTGFEGSNPLNPWDVVLAMEGAIIFAGALTRSWGSKGTNHGAAFPFMFDHTGAASGIFSSEDPNRPRGEVWVPLWNKPATFFELAAIFSEGRLTLGNRTAQTGLDAARAVSQIGLARGITSFERYSLIRPDTKMPHQATPLGRIDIPSRPHQDLTADLETGLWLEKARQLADRKESPSRVRHAMRRLEDSLFQMTNAVRASEGTRNALMAIGSLVNWLTTNRIAREEIDPPPRLSRGWIQQADDSTPEFRVATALASLGLPPLGPRVTPYPSGSASSNEAEFAFHDESQEEVRQSSVSMLPMAAHFAPINEEYFVHGAVLNRRRKWITADTSPTVVWRTGSLVSNMIAVLERRIIEASMRGFPDKPMTGAYFARISDITAFLEGNFDDTRCTALLAGLVWAVPTVGLRSALPSEGEPISQLPFAYAALKPVFSTDADLRHIGFLDNEAHLPLPPGLLARLRIGGEKRDGQATDEAVRTALRRARASGLVSPFDSTGVYSNTTGRIGAGVRADRLAASLLVPIGYHSLKSLVARVWSDVLPNGDSQMKEMTDDT